MPNVHLSAETIDDLMRVAINKLLSCGEKISPSKGPARELIGVQLELINPRARLSRTETRGKLFSCLGELCWYLAKSNELDFISYYIPEYKNFAEEGIIFGAYGPRLFSWKGQNQVEFVIERLKSKPYSRRGIIQLFEAQDLREHHKDVPCTCTLQFLNRGNRLHMVTHMRSNDVFFGFPHDIFSFTMLQEIIARSISVRLGSYTHSVGSLHLYDAKEKAARQFIAEGWQSTMTAMPPMPNGDPWDAIASLLKFEATLRDGNHLDTVSRQSNGIAPYWTDLMRLLQIFSHHKRRHYQEIQTLREEISNDYYHAFIDQKVSQVPQSQVETKNKEC